MARPLRMLLLAALLATATVAAYAPTFSADFVDIDDADYVPENEMVLAGLGADGVAWAFGGAHAGNWIPLTWLSHMLDVDLFGVEPGAHHAMNVALHVANALLLFGMLTSLTGAIAPSLAVAALFALHPVNVESVAWISQRKTTLSTGFGILAIWSYARFTRTGARGSYAASLLSFAASLLAKQTLVTMPFALLLLDWWPLRRTDAMGWRRLLLEKLPYALFAAVASAATIAAQGEAISTGATYPLAVRIGNAVLSVVRYVGLFVWPTKLAVFHPLYVEDVTPARVTACALLLVAASGAAFALRRTRRHLLVGWLWFVGTLVPVIGLVQVGSQAMADRYAYVPFWGLSLALVWSAWEPMRAHRAWRAAVSGGFVAVSGALAVLTYEQATKWHDSIALFEDAVADTERNYVAERALAGQYFNRGEYTIALRHAEEGAKYPRDLGEVLPVYGMALYQTGAKAEAIAKLEEATRVAPRSAIGFSNLGWVYLQEGDVPRAADALAAAVSIDPQNVQSQYLLATSQLRLGHPDEAAAGFARVVAIDPLHFDAWIEQARTLGKLGRFEESAAVLQDALAAAAGFPIDRRDRLVATLQRYRTEVLTAQAAREARDPARTPK